LLIQIMFPKFRETIGLVFLILMVILTNGKIVVLKMFVILKIAQKPQVLICLVKLSVIQILMPILFAQMVYFVLFLDAATARLP